MSPHLSRQQRRSRVFFALAVMAVAALFYDWCPAFALEYYLSPTGNDVRGTGSYANPWRSPAKARKSTGAIQPGDTVIFKDGVYTYGPNDCLLGWTADDAGQSGRPITYRAETRGGVTIDFGGGYGWRLDSAKGCAYVTLDGFNLVNVGQFGVRFGDVGQIVRYINVTATPTWPPSGSPGDNARGGGGFATTATAVNFAVENCIADNCAKTNDSHGIYCGGGSGIIRDSVFRNNVGNGIQIQAANADHNIDTVYVYRNKVHDNKQRHGIYVSAYGGGSIKAVQIYNNLVWSNGTDYASGYGVTVGNGVTYADCYNNTLYNNKYGLQHLAQGGSLKNNIVVGSQAGIDINANTKSNVNVSLSSNLETGGFANSNFESTDPGSAGFLKLKPSASMAVNMGTDTGLKNDYFGTERPQNGKYDIGAHEIIAAPRNLRIVE